MPSSEDTSTLHYITKEHERHRYVGSVVCWARCYRSSYSSWYSSCYSSWYSSCCCSEYPGTHPQPPNTIKNHYRWQTILQMTTMTNDKIAYQFSLLHRPTRANSPCPWFTDRGKLIDYPWFTDRTARMPREAGRAGHGFPFFKNHQLNFDVFFFRI